MIHRSLDRLTPTERRVALVLLGDYPFPGLETVAEFARRGQVSNPTVLRLIGKLSFPNYATFQAALRAELQARGNTPLLRGSAEHASPAAAGDFLDRYRSSVLGCIDRSLERIPRSSFEKVAFLLAEPKLSISLLGGRLTGSLALQLYNHLRLMRANVLPILQPGAIASEDLVDFDTGSVLIVFDIRRYQKAVIKVAEEAHRRGATIVLFTDIWLSPISSFAKHVFALETEVVSSWDSFTVFSAVIEALLARIGEQHWSAVRERMLSVRDIRIHLDDDIP